jgi:uncharacterized protein (DUF362 family)
MKPTTVFVHRDKASAYPDAAPFHPTGAYPEYSLGVIGVGSNLAYDAVRSTFHLAGLDDENFDTPLWNPLKELIRPGETILLKPNLIKESHPRYPDGWRYIMTHGSVIRAVADYIWKALEGHGKLIIADAPQTDSSFEKIIRVLGLDTIQEFYRSQDLDLELIDLRLEEWQTEGGVITQRSKLKGDPRGAVSFDLGSASEFANHTGSGRYYGADYDDEVVNARHSDGRHQYLLSGTAIQCDVIFSIPKLKTHKKAGITVSLKNLVGVTADKNWLPHHTEGDPSNLGDEHPSPDVKHKTERLLLPYVRRLSGAIPFVGLWLHQRARKIGTSLMGDSETVIRSGNWWGNDTTWRMCLDLNKLVFYGNLDGTLRDGSPKNRKRHYVLVDAIVAGEGRGPLNPDPVSMGTLLFGLNPASVDAACAYLVGFDPERIPILKHAFQCQNYPLAEWNWNDVQIVSNKPEWNGLLVDIPQDETFKFEPHFGWKTRIERQSEQAEHQSTLTRTGSSEG